MGKLSLKNAAMMCAKEFTITFADGSTEKIWVRTRTQSETDNAFEASVEQRLAIREKYGKDTLLYKALKAEVEELTNDELAMRLVSMDMAEIGHKARLKLPKLIPFDETKYRGKAELAKAQEAYEQRQAEYDEQLEAMLEELIEEKKKKLAEDDKANLVDLLLRVHVQDAINQDVHKLLENYYIYDCIRDGEDHDKPYFDGLDDIPDVMPVRSLLIEKINEVDRIVPFDIKN